ncbi:MAG: 3-hydroxyacyl-ACP dehydratase FabZ, partial [Planctomycetes bacterium]|nr:3-hydroxyacyl-ACP dehydratase FabZ [Planctomycetota bacterium]
TDCVHKCLSEERQREGTGPSPAASRACDLTRDIAAIKKGGPIRGGSLDSAIALTETGLLHETPLRFPDEPVRHKILDLIGDLYMANVSFHARIVAVKSGHASNAKFVRKTVDVIREHRLRGIALSEPLLDIRGIQKSLPHRYPFLLVDRVIAIEEDRRIVGLKNVTFNEPFFQGHWPDQPVMPGVLLIEALAQIAGVLLLRRIEYSGKLTLLVAMDHVKLRKAVVPGDQVRLEAEIERATGSRAKVNAKASVDGKPVASALLKFMLADTEPA